MSMPRAISTLGFVLATLAVAGCERGFPTAEDRPSISEDAFVAAVAELRHMGLNWEEGHAPAEERDRVLGGLGIEAGELVEFVEIHGRNVPYMYGVWVRVDSAVVEKGAALDEEASPDPDPPS
jgi:hypothetical protein